MSEADVEKAKARSDELAEASLDAMRAITGDEVDGADMVGIVLASARVLAAVLYAAKNEMPELYDGLVKVALGIVDTRDKKPGEAQ